jgi:hypothetical protein
VGLVTAQADGCLEQRLMARCKDLDEGIPKHVHVGPDKLSSPKSSRGTATSSAGVQNTAGLPGDFEPQRANREAFSQELFRCILISYSGKSYFRDELSGRENHPPDANFGCPAGRDSLPAATSWAEAEAAHKTLSQTSNSKSPAHVEVQHHPKVLMRWEGGQRRS